MDSFNKIIGGRIKDRRLALRLTRDNLARMAMISEKFLYEIEVGKKGMSAETLYNVAKALEISTDFLLFGHATEQENQLLKV